MNTLVAPVPPVNRQIDVVSLLLSVTGTQDPPPPGVSNVAQLIAVLLVAKVFVQAVLAAFLLGGALALFAVSRLLH
jgi:hypothetical protein